MFPLLFYDKLILFVIIVGYFGNQGQSVNRHSLTFCNANACSNLRMVLTGTSKYQMKVSGYLPPICLLLQNFGPLNSLRL